MHECATLHERIACGGARADALAAGAAEALVTGLALLAFMFDNKNSLREMSLRMGPKIGDLAKIGPNWKNIAKVTCMRREGE